MNALPYIICKNGFTYIKVLREGQKAIYRQDVPPDLTYFEVFKIQVSKERSFNGVSLPERETFPGNEDFGQTAWSFRTLAEAMKRFDEL